MKQAVKEIKRAITQMGYRNFDFYCECCGHHRYCVYVNKEYFGVYDLDRHTFVD